MNGLGLYRLSSLYLRGYRDGFRINPSPYRWARIWTLLAACLFGVSLGITWTAVNLAMQHTSIGEVVAQTRIGKIAAWLRVKMPAANREGRR